MSKAKQVEQIIIRNFENELKLKFIELKEINELKVSIKTDVYQKGLEAFPIIFNQQINEIHQMHCRVRKLIIVGVINSAIETAIEYKVNTDTVPQWYKIGFKLIPMHTLH